MAGRRQKRQPKVDKQRQQKKARSRTVQWSEPGQRSKSEISNQGVNSVLTLALRTRGRGGGGEGGGRRRGGGRPASENGLIDYAKGSGRLSTVTKKLS